MKRKLLSAALVVMLLVIPLAVFAGGPWADNFDSYTAGSDLHGQGGWKGWDNNPAGGALVDNSQANSAPNSVAIATSSDLVQEFSGATAGQWIFTAWQYIPDSLVGQTYFILLNSYADSGPYNWSLQLCFDSATGMVIDDVAGACSDPGLASIVYDQWVEIRAEIDLDANTQSVYYNGALLFTDSWTEHVSGGGAATVAALDLFANRATTVYYDDMSFSPPQPTDVNLTSFSDGPAMPGPWTIAIVMALVIGVGLIIVRRRAADSIV